MLIRRYQTADNQSVKALYYSGLEQFDADLRTDGYLALDKDLDDIENVYLNNSGEFLVGILDGKLVAMGALKKLSTTRGEIKRMSVHPYYQRRGFGQTVLLRLLELADQFGYTELYLNTTAQNIPAQKLYEKSGFIQIQRRKIGRLEVIFYKKQLAMNQAKQNT